MKSAPRVHVFSTVLVFAGLFICGCAGPQGVNLGAHVGAGGAFKNHSRTEQTGTGMPRDPSLATPRRTIDSGTYLYHEPATGKSAPFKIGMSQSTAELAIRAQGIVMTRDNSSGPEVLVLGPGPSTELLVKLRFVNGKLVEIEVPA